MNKKHIQDQGHCTKRCCQWNYDCVDHCPCPMFVCLKTSCCKVSMTTTTTTTTGLFSTVKAMNGQLITMYKQCTTEIQECISEWAKKCRFSPTHRKGNPLLYHSEVLQTANPKALLTSKDSLMGNNMNRSNKKERTRELCTIAKIYLIEIYASQIKRQSETTQRKQVTPAPLWNSRQLY